MAKQQHTSATATTRAPALRQRPASVESTPDEELKMLKEALAHDQREADVLKRKVDGSQARIKELEKALAEAGQVRTVWSTAMQGIAIDRLEIQGFLSNELPQIEKHEQVKSRKPEIEAKIEEVDAVIHAKDGQRQILDQKLKEEKAGLQAANDDFAAKRRELDALKNRHREIQDKFSRLRKIRQRIDGEAANRPLVKYVLALELKRVWDQTEGLFTSEEEIETAYYAKAEEVRAAAAAASAQDEKYKLALGDLEASREDLEARRSGRLEDVIKRVSELSPRLPAGVGAAIRAR